MRIRVKTYKVARTKLSGFDMVDVLGVYRSKSSVKIINKILNKRYEFGRVIYLNTIKASDFYRHQVRGYPLSSKKALLKTYKYLYLKYDLTR